MTVFRFTIWYDNDYEFMQNRYVVAHTEEEAIEKLCKYNEWSVKSGCMKFDFDYNPLVELENVIV